MKTGIRVYLRPERFFTVLFKHEDGKIQIQEGKGGASFSVDSDRLSIAPTLVKEEDQAYWEEEARNMKKYLSDRLKNLYRRDNED